MKPVSGGGSFHVLPLKALLGATPPSTGQHQPLQFSKAVFSFSDNTEEAKSPGPVDSTSGLNLVCIPAQNTVGHKKFRQSPVTGVKVPETSHATAPKIDS